MIDPRFLLEAKLGNPTRMSLSAVTAYWKHWSSKSQKGDPFSFLNLDDSDDDRDKSGSKSGESEKDGGNRGDDGAGNPSTSSPDHFAIDDNIPYPLLCETSERTGCLQALVSTQGQVNKTFHQVVRMVDSMEVSPILCI